MRRSRRRRRGVPAGFAGGATHQLNRLPLGLEGVSWESFVMVVRRHAPWADAVAGRPGALAAPVSA
jgi:hypothetical protein